MNTIEFSLCEAIKTSHKDNRNPIDDNAKRIFKMASYINCNGEILKNIHIKKYMEKIMDQYNIDNYQIKTVDNQYEFGYELIIDEKNYRKIYQQLSSH